MTDFTGLSERTGIPLPALLMDLWSSGLTGQSAGSEADEPPAMSTCIDFEWLQPAYATTTVAEWLNPQHQSGRRFLPFGQTGAGDAWCLMPISDGEVGVALVWHDADVSRVDHRTVDDFAAAQFLQAFADMDHLVDAADVQTAVLALRADVAHVTRRLDAPTRDLLVALCAADPEQRPFRHGPKARPRTVWSLISQQRLSVELPRFQRADGPSFPVAPRWECG